MRKPTINATQDQFENDVYGRFFSDNPAVLANLDNRQGIYWSICGTFGISLQTKSSRTLPTSRRASRSPGSPALPRVPFARITNCRTIAPASHGSTAITSVIHSFGTRSRPFLPNDKGGSPLAPIRDVAFIAAIYLFFCGYVYRAEYYREFALPVSTTLNDAISFYVNSQIVFQDEWWTAAQFGVALALIYY